MHTRNPSHPTTPTAPDQPALPRQAAPHPLPPRVEPAHSGAPRPRRRGLNPGRRLAASLLWTAGCVTTGLVVPGVAEASTLLAEAQSLQQVIDNLRGVLVGLLVGLATLFATVGGVRYILSGGDPGEAEAAKKTLRYAAIGYAVAILAPMLVKLLQKIVEA